MGYLLTGLLLFCGVHLSTALAPSWGERTRARIGAGAFKGGFAVLSLLGILLMIWGWRQTQPVFVYRAPAVLVLPAFALTFIGFLLMALPQRESVIKRYVRHPQLTGVLLWAIAHLWLNGDLRSLVLFGGLGIWCVLEIFALNRRDGPSDPPAAPGIAYELKTLAVATAVFALVIALHPWLAGVSALRPL